MALSRKTFCLLGLFAATICVSIILALALTTRYVWYPDITNTDMPSDMRCVDRGTSSKFCKRHQVTAKLADNSPSSNSKAEFDAYVTSQNPKETITTETNKKTVKGRRAISSWPSESFFHGFNILRGSTADVYLCSKGDNAIGFWFYAIQGFKNFTHYKESVQNEPLGKCDGQQGCLQSEFIWASKKCETENPKDSKEYKGFHFEFNDTAETYYYWYAFDNTNTSMKNTGKQTIYTWYDMQHTMYNKSLAKKTASRESTQEMEGAQYVILDFQYFNDNLEAPLNNIRVVTHCVPDLGMYMLCFLLPGAFFVILIGCITVPYALSDKRDRATLITRVTDYNIVESGTYGAINE